MLTFTFSSLFSNRRKSLGGEMGFIPPKDFICFHHCLGLDSFRWLTCEWKKVPRHIFLTWLRRTLNRAASPLASGSWRCLMRDLKWDVVQAGSLEQDFKDFKGNRVSIPVRMMVSKVASLSSNLWCTVSRELTNRICQ